MSRSRYPGFRWRASTSAAVSPAHLSARKREPGDFYDLEDIGSWTRTSPDFHAVLAIENNDTPMDAPAGVRTVTGRVDQAIADLSDVQESDVYVAGPPATIAATLGALDRVGVPRGRVHVDSFGSCSAAPAAASPGRHPLGSGWRPVPRL